MKKAPPPDDEFLFMSAAKQWGLTPSQWDACEVVDRARMLAHELIAGTRQAYNDCQARKRAEADAKASAAGKGDAVPNDYVRMKQRFLQKPH